MTRFIFMVGLVLILVGCEEQRFPTGRDTYRSFADGRFQIGRITGGEKPLMDVKTGRVILVNVYDYRRTREAIYFVGAYEEPISYVVITLNDGEIHRFKGITEVDEAIWKDELQKLDPARRL